MKINGLFMLITRTVSIFFYIINQMTLYNNIFKIPPLDDQECLYNNNNNNNILHLNNVLPYN